MEEVEVSHQEAAGVRKLMRPINRALEFVDNRMPHPIRAARSILDLMDNDISSYAFNNPDEFSHLRGFEAPQSRLQRLGSFLSNTKDTLVEVCFESKGIPEDE